METELWSMNEKRTYRKENATITNINGVMVLTTPSKEPLVMKIR